MKRLIVVLIRWGCDDSSALSGCSSSASQPDEDILYCKGQYSEFWQSC